MTIDSRVTLLYCLWYNYPSTVKCMVYKYGRRIWGAAIPKNTDTIREQRTQAQADSLTGVPQREIKSLKTTPKFALCSPGMAWYKTAVKTKLLM